MTKHLLTGLIGAGLLFLSTGPVQAGPITWELDVLFSGDQPSGVPVATITTTAANTVELKMTAPNFGSEFVSNWYFNSAIDATTLNFSGPTKSGTFTDPNILTCFNCTTGAHKADGDGFFDIVFQFATSSANRFDGNDMATYVITGDGLTASNFNILSLADTGAGGHGPFLTAAQVQGLADGGSGWVTVPAPTSLFLFGTGLIGLIGIARREMLVNLLKGK